MTFSETRATVFFSHPAPGDPASSTLSPPRFIFQYPVPTLAPQEGCRGIQKEREEAECRPLVVSPPSLGVSETPEKLPNPYLKYDGSHSAIEY